LKRTFLKLWSDRIRRDGNWVWPDRRGHFAGDYRHRQRPWHQPEHQVYRHQCLVEV